MFAHFALTEDIPVQPNLDDKMHKTSSGPDGSSAGSKVLVSISEEENIPMNGSPEELAQPNMKKDGKENSSSRSNEERSLSTSSGSIKFTPTKFSAGNLAIPGLKRKEKNKNGEEKGDGSKVAVKGDSKKQKNGSKQNGKEGEEKSGRKEQEQIQQQLFEMKIISRPSSTASQEQVRS